MESLTHSFKPLFADSEPDDLSSHRYRQLIGGLGFFLPILLYVVAGVRPTEGLQNWALLDSVSAYYHTGAVAVFVGILAALGIFLVTYRGYDNPHKRWDRLTGGVAGIAVIGVALFPAKAPVGAANPSWWTSKTGAIHYGCALVLFSAFIVFSVILFPKTNTQNGTPLAPGKKARNLFYYLFGAGMLACMVWIAAVSVLSGGPIFWPEAIALECFALSWLLKGRADWTVAGAGRRALHYGRHPAVLMEKTLKAFRG